MPPRVVKVVLSAQVAEYNANMLKAAQATRTVGTESEKLAQQKEAFEKLGRAAGVTGVALTSLAALSSKAAISWESAWAGVTKTVDGTPEQLKRVENGLRGLTSVLPASHEEIAAVAEAAGQLGIETGSVVAFTKTMIDLGETTNLSANDAATSLARFVNIMGTSQAEVSNLGSALVGLGNNYATTESEIMEMAMRLAGAGKQIGLSEGDVLGLSAALSSVGIEAEAGGSAMSKVMIDIAASVEDGGDRLQMFANVAGMSADSFAQKWRTAPAEALAAFVTGLGNAEAQGGSALGILSELEITEVRMRDALLRSSSAADMFAGAMAQGNKEFEANNALTAEAEKRYQTVESKLKIAGNAVRDAAIDFGQVFLPAISSAAGGVQDFANFLGSLPEPVQGIISVVGGATGAVALLAGGALLAVPKILEFKTALIGMGMEARTASRLVNGALKGLGTVAGIGTALAIIQQIDDSLKGAGISATELGNALTKTDVGSALERSLEGTGSWFRNQAGVMKQAEKGFEDFGGAIDEVAASMDTRWAGAFGNFVDWLDGSTAPTDNYRDALQSLGEALAAMPADAASETMRKLRDEYKLTNEQIDTLIDNSGPYREALIGQVDEAGKAANAETLREQALNDAAAAAEKSGDETETAAEKTQRLADEASNAADDLDDLLTALERVGGAATDMYSAIDDAQGSINDMAKAAKENKASLEGSNDESLKLRDTMRDVEAAHRDAAAAIIQNGGSIEDATAKWREGREAIIKQRIAMGDSREEARAWADEQLGSAGEVARALADVKSAADAIPDEKSMRLNVNTSSAINTLQGFINRYGTLQGTINYRAVTSVATGAERPGRALGGAIRGPGTATSDSIPAMLSDGEHVLTAADVAAMGGQDAVYQWRESLHGKRVKRYAKGGAVTYKIDRSELADWQKAWRRGEVRSDAMNGNALRLVDQLFDIAAQIGGKYGATLNREARRSESAFRGLERSSAAAEKRVESLSDRVSDLKDSASSMASRVSSAIRSFFDIGALATTKTVTTGTSSARVVNGITIAGAGVTTSEQNTTTAGSIRSSLGASASRIKGYAEKLKRLAAKGINAALLEELASLGVEKGEPITDALLTASKSDISAINKSYSEIGKYSDAAGKTVADANFSKLISAAEKQLRDAKRNADSIERKLEKEATRIINTINRALISGTTTPVKKKATGGPIYGPGTETSDSIPAFLSNNENVWSAADVRAAGGQAEVERMKRFHRMSPTAARYALGGPVGVAMLGPAEAGVTVLSDESIDRLSDRMAGRVAGAILQVRSADARDAVMAAARGVRS